MPLPPPRPYQDRAYRYLSKAVADDLGRRIIVHGPTGCGKSWLMARLLMDDVPQILFTHRKALLNQLSQVLSDYGIRHGLRAAGKPTDPGARIQLAMIQSEHSSCFKRQEWPVADAVRVHVDERHAINGPQALEVIDSYRSLGASVLSYTATPSRLGPQHDELYTVETVPNLIRDGYLVQPTVFTPDGPACDRLENCARSSDGNFGPAGLSKIWQPKMILGRVIEQYRRINPEGRPTLGFGSGVAESLWFAEQFCAAGIRAAHVDGKDLWVDGVWYENSDDNRTSVFKEVARGDLVLWNRFVLREGIDIPEVSHIILATVFGSRASYVQSCGRGSRGCKGKTMFTIQDHGGNAWRFPELDTDEPWDLYATDGQQATQRRDDQREGRIPEPIVCPQCDVCRTGGDRCPYCGHKHVTTSRRVAQLDGSLHIKTGPLNPPRKTSINPGDAKRWKGLVIGAKKKGSDRTLRQLYAFYAQQNKWQWLPKTIPFMPLDNYVDAWDVPVKNLDLSWLRPELETCVQ